MLVRPVILSGGSGTRLWPVSRRRYPKQFAPLLGDACLFERTLSRVLDRSIFAAPLIIGNTEHRFLIQDVLDHLNITDATVLLEPMGRNTAAAAIVASLADGGTEASILHLVMPSDQTIADEAAFMQIIQKALPEAVAGQFVLFGITPDHPETGYGYIVPQSKNDGHEILKIKTFREKPSVDQAEKLIAEGAMWNSGIFLYAPKTLCAEAARLAPAYYDLCVAAWKDSKAETAGQLLDAKAYEAMADHAFDRLIMEQTSFGAVVPCAMGWNDVGAWKALWEISAKDEAGNNLAGSVVTHDVKNSYIHTTGPTVAALGVEGMTIVATKDAILITPMNRSQEVKTLVASLDVDAPAMSLEHVRVMRPWGTYESVAKGQGFQVKQITVLPGRALSLQMHHHRAEHWIVVAGTAKIECNGDEKLLFPNESFYIPHGAKHRLTNPGIINLQLVEVQSGDYVGEDDIVRFEDNYGR